MKNEQSTTDQIKSQLKEKHIEVLQLMSDGDSYTQTAKKVFKSHRTVQKYGQDICEIIGVKNIRQAIIWAIRHNIIQ